MKRIVKIEGVGNVVFPDSLSDVEVSQAAGRLYDDATPARKGSTATDAASNAGVTGQAAKSAEDTSGWRHIQTADKKHFLIHPGDLEEAKKRDANLIIHDQQ